MGVASFIILAVFVSDRWSMLLAASIHPALLPVTRCVSTALGPAAWRIAMLLYAILCSPVTPVLVCIGSTASSCIEYFA